MNALTDDQRAAVQRLMLALPDEASAFAALGRSLGAAATGGNPEPRGRAAWARRAQELTAAICGNGALKAFCNDEDAKDATDVAIAVAGALLAAKVPGIDVYLCACVAARIGLRKICAAHWTPTV